MGSEQIRKRQLNRYRFLRSLHFHGSLTRGRISELLGIRKSSITSIAGEMIGCGLVREERPGKVRSALMLDRTRYHAIAVSISASAIEVSCVGLDGESTDFRRVAYAGARSPAAVFETVVRLCGERFRPDDCLGIGVGVPGLVDPERGVCLRNVHLDGWRDVAVAAALARHFSVPVLVDNDVRAQLWACSWFDRLARDTDNVVYLQLHEGIACAMLMEGRRIIGERFAAGEIGHVRAGDRGKLCSCGKTDCLEAYCSHRAIVEEIRALRPHHALGSAGEIARLAERDPVVVNVLDRVAQRLAPTVAGLVAAIDPHVLVLGTASRHFSELFRPLLKRHLYTELIGIDACDADIKVADEVGTMTLRGAAGLVIHHVFQSGMDRLLGRV